MTCALKLEQIGLMGGREPTIKKANALRKTTYVMGWDINKNEDSLAGAELVRVRYALT